MQEFFNNIMPNVVERFPTFLQAIWDTIIMVIWSGSIAFGLGMLFGVMLTVTKPAELWRIRLYIRFLIR